MKAVGLQLALDLMHEKEHRDLITGLKSRTNAGRPNWNKVFTQLRQQVRCKFSFNATFNLEAFNFINSFGGIKGGISHQY